MAAPDEPHALAMPSRFRAALILAVAADAFQLVLYPMFLGGVFSPADDVLDFVVGGALIGLLGWHWEFLPSFFIELIPGVDLAPTWILAVANVYRKWKRTAMEADAADVGTAGKKLP
jgi:hypothetical protein